MRCFFVAVLLSFFLLSCEREIHEPKKILREANATGKSIETASFEKLVDRRSETDTCFTKTRIKIKKIPGDSAKYKFKIDDGIAAAIYDGKTFRLVYPNQKRALFAREPEVAADIAERYSERFAELFVPEGLLNAVEDDSQFSSIRFGGIEDVEGKDCYVIEMREGYNDVSIDREYYIDLENLLIRRFDFIETKGGMRTKESVTLLRNMLIDKEIPDSVFTFDIPAEFEVDTIKI